MSINLANITIRHLPLSSLQEDQKSCLCKSQAGFCSLDFVASPTWSHLSTSNSPA